MPGVKSSQHYPAKDAFNAGLIQPLLPLIFLNLFLAVSPGPQLIRPLLGLFMQLLSVLCRLALTSGVMPVNRAISSPNCKFCNTKGFPLVLEATIFARSIQGPNTFLYSCLQVAQTRHPRCSKTDFPYYLGPSHWHKSNPQLRHQKEMIKAIILKARPHRGTVPFCLSQYVYLHTDPWPRDCNRIYALQQGGTQNPAPKTASLKISLAIFSLIKIGPCRFIYWFLLSSPFLAF